MHRLLGIAHGGRAAGLPLSVAGQSWHAVPQGYRAATSDIEAHTHQHDHTHTPEAADTCYSILHHEH